MELIRRIIDTDQRREAPSDKQNEEGEREGEEEDFGAWSDEEK